MAVWYHIVDNVTSEPDRYVKAWNSSTGLVTEMTTDYSLAFGWSTEAARNAAITLINSGINAGSFIGHVPPPPKH